MKEGMSVERGEDGGVVHIVDITSLHRLASWGHGADC